MGGGFGKLLHSPRKKNSFHSFSSRAGFAFQILLMIRASPVALTAFVSCLSVGSESYPFAFPKIWNSLRDLAQHFGEGLVVAGKR